VISCKTAVSRLYAYLDRNLGRVPESEVEEHLKLCRHCCGELEFAKQVRAALRRPGAATALTPDVRAHIDAYLKELKNEPGAKR
jgi:predicted anti-sigma-YlaC factor YlaD